jgi:hypothetical protein
VIWYISQSFHGDKMQWNLLWLLATSGCVNQLVCETWANLNNLALMGQFKQPGPDVSHRGFHRILLVWFLGKQISKWNCLLSVPTPLRYTGQHTKPIKVCCRIATLTMHEDFKFSNFNKERITPWRWSFWLKHVGVCSSVSNILITDAELVLC